MKKLLLKFVALLGLFLFLGSGNAWAYNWALISEDTDLNPPNDSEFCKNGNPGSQNGTTIVKFEKLSLTKPFKIVRGLNDNDGKIFKYGNYLTLPFGVEAKGYDTDYIVLNKKLKDATVTLSIGGTWGDDCTHITIEGTIDIPTTLYLMGDVNDYAWDTSKGIKATSSNGIFNWTNVEVNKSKDSKIENGFINIGTILGKDWDEVNKGDRYGSLPSKQDGDNGDIILDPGNVLDIEHYAVYFNSSETESWEMVPGTYDITVDLNTMKISASKKVNHSWTGNGVSVKDGSYTFNGIHDTNNSVDLKSDDNAINHQHVELVSVECSQQHSVKQVRATASSVDGCYTFDNGTLTFNHAGTYNVISQVSDNVTGYHSDQISLVANIEPKIVTFAEGASEALGQPFGTSGVTTFNDLFNLSEELTYGTDFTVSVATTGDTENWAKGSTLEELQTALEEVTQATLWKQYSDLGTTSIDGFLDAAKLGVNQVDKSDTKYNDKTYYNVTLGIPCSGVYTVTVNVTNPNYKADGQTSYDIAVYPNLRGKFGGDYGFNINGYTFTSESTGESDPNQIILPETETDAQLKNATGYIPGTYFANSFSISTEKSDASNIKRRAGYDFANTPYMSIVDLRQLNESAITSLPIYVSISKNGASHTWEFTVEKGSEFGVSTGIEGITSEEGEAVYYNLQGVRVENPEHGIFVKVVNGKATKIVR